MTDKTSLLFQYLVNIKFSFKLSMKIFDIVKIDAFINARFKNDYCHFVWDMFHANRIDGIFYCFQDFDGNLIYQQIGNDPTDENPILINISWLFSIRWENFNPLKIMRLTRLAVFQWRQWGYFQPDAGYKPTISKYCLRGAF